MSLNIYECEEEKTPAYDEQYENYKGDYSHILDLYNTGCQSPISSKWSNNRPHTGSYKYIRKVKLMKKQKSNQYTSEEQNFIIRKIVSSDGVNITKQKSNQSQLQKKANNKIIKMMKQLNLN
ncbi:unnamed protein product [Paramecium sonneborni]|uniref:Uncharacterized protein n=1 Tax=Paramecium sonneborni TaxID=65129 RepID=A0A8S1QTE2_9CILI|nr:unnamed protein product [Paramecium sonneborni]